MSSSPRHGQKIELTILLVVLSTDSICKCKPYNAPQLKKEPYILFKRFLEFKYVNSHVCAWRVLIFSVSY
jgi:hypothetical protein